jgi:hypothetical protein
MLKDVGNEHGEHGAEDYPDGGPELQVLPAVVDDENAHHGNRGVDGPVEIDRP